MAKIVLDVAKLRMWRAYRGLTKHKMSQLMGYAGDGYYYIESGKVEPSLKRINQICEILDISPLDILVVEDEKKEEGEHENIGEVR